MRSNPGYLLKSFLLYNKNGKLKLTYAIFFRIAFSAPKSASYCNKSKSSPSRSSSISIVFFILFLFFLSIIEVATCFHEFSEYKSTNFFNNIYQLKTKVNFLLVKNTYNFFLSFKNLRKSKKNTT